MLAGISYNGFSRVDMRAFDNNDNFVCYIQAISIRVSTQPCGTIYFLDSQNLRHINKIIILAANEQGQILKSSLSDIDILDDFNGQMGSYIAKSFIDFPRGDNGI